MTLKEKENLVQMMKTEYKDSWDEYDKKSFLDDYLESQMVEDMVMCFIDLIQRKKLKSLFYLKSNRIKI